MKIVAQLHILREYEGGRPYTSLKKEIETSLLPMPGMYLADRAWNDEREILSVVLDPSEDCYYIRLGYENGKTEDHCKELVEMYGWHGWKDARFK